MISYRDLDNSEFNRSVGSSETRYRSGRVTKFSTASISALAHGCSTHYYQRLYLEYTKYVISNYYLNWLVFLSDQYSYRDAKSSKQISFRNKLSSK